MDKVGKLAEERSAVLKGPGTEFIDLTSYGTGKGVVIARYPDQAAMDAAAETAKKVFGEMIAAGAVEEDSVHPHTGDVFKSF